MPATGCGCAFNGRGISSARPMWRWTCSSARAAGPCRLPSQRLRSLEVAAQGVHFPAGANSQPTRNIAAQADGVRPEAIAGLAVSACPGQGHVEQVIIERLQDALAPLVVKFAGVERAAHVGRVAQRVTDAGEGDQVAFVLPDADRRGSFRAAPGHALLAAPGSGLLLFSRDV